MQRCPQTQNQSVLEHGFSVNRHLRDLASDQPKLDWKLPPWWDDYRAKLLAAAHTWQVMDHYTVYHDCGKPYCLIEDERGLHFPDHAETSKNIYLSLEGDPTVAGLIGWDMVLHTATAKELDDYLKCWSKQDAATLLLSAISEIHSNAAMFGGIDSLSFKIKWKRLRKRGKQLCKHLFGYHLV